MKSDTESGTESNLRDLARYHHRVPTQDSGVRRRKLSLTPPTRHVPHRWIKGFACLNPKCARHVVDYTSPVHQAGAKDSKEL